MASFMSFQPKALLALEQQTCYGLLAFDREGVHLSTVHDKDQHLAESTSNPDKQRCSPNACYPDPASALAQCAQYIARYGGVMGELWAAEVQPLDEDSRTSLWPSSTFDSSRLLAHDS